MDAGLVAQVRSLPAKPGVYQFKDPSGTILYVGKANSLKNRVRSYLKPIGIKHRRLMDQATTLDFIVTGSELEALLLECNLIKQHRPKYNVRLRDDKTYPYIKVDVNDPWPRVYITRRVERDGAKYYGPFTDSGSVRRTLDLLNKLFPYRSCTMTITGKEVRPCLDYHIKRCLGPCIGVVPTEDYRGVIDQVCLFLEGKQEILIKQLREKMETAAEQLEFERAAYLRDQIGSLEKVVERQKIISTKMKNQDVVAFARNNGEACVQVFFIRSGKVMGREHFVLEGTQEEDSKEIMTSFVTQFYDNAAFVPEEIILQHEVERLEVVEQWLRDKRGDKVSITIPRRGEKLNLVEQVAENAAETLEQLRLRWLENQKKTTEAVRELAQHLGLDDPPHRIECYDISNVQGRSAVGAMVVFEDGQPQNAKYRRFEIKTVTGANDFAMLAEVLRRRFKRARDAGDANDTKGWTSLPNLVIIDGGRGQLNAALDVMRDLGAADIPTVALAKEREEIYTPELPQPIYLPRNSQALYLVQRIRDETHRFAITYHRQKRKQRGMRSLLDEIPGIGGRRKTALLRELGSVKAIREADVATLAAVPGMTLAAAQKLKELL